MTLTRWELYERQLAKFRPIPLKTTHSSGGVEVVRCRPAEGGWEIFYIVTYQGQEWSRWSSPEGALERASNRWRKERKGEPDPFQPLLLEIVKGEWKKVEESRGGKYPPARSAYEGRAYLPSDLDPEERMLYGD